MQYIFDNKDEIKKFAINELNVIDDITRDTDLITLLKYINVNDKQYSIDKYNIYDMSIDDIHICNELLISINKKLIENYKDKVDKTTSWLSGSSN